MIRRKIFNRKNMIVKKIRYENIFLAMIKSIFCKHEWELICKSSQTIDNKAYDTQYDFECKKCGRVKIVKTKGLAIIE